MLATGCETMTESALYPNRLHVVIPCRNCEAYIGDCLDSLQRQTFADWTALVADDASDDGTADAVRAYMQEDARISLRQGVQREWLMGNTLAALRSLDPAPSDVVAILDGDDWLLPECLDRIMRAHREGYDLVYTDEEIDGGGHSIAAPLIASAPVRKQSWRFSQLRSFKAYLFSQLPDETFRDRDGNYFRAAGDLALYLPMAELAGPEKVRYIPEKLYHYRVHEQCNFKVMRDEQLRNNWDIRNRPPLERQTEYFDVTEEIRGLDKSRLPFIGPEARDRHPRPLTVNIRHIIPREEADAWRPYHGLWIEDGVFLSGEQE